MIYILILLAVGSLLKKTEKICCFGLSLVNYFYFVLYGLIVVFLCFVQFNAISFATFFPLTIMNFCPGYSYYSWFKAACLKNRA